MFGDYCSLKRYLFYPLPSTVFLFFLKKNKNKTQNILFHSPPICVDCSSFLSPLLPLHLSVKRGCVLPTIEISGASFRISRASARNLIDRGSDHNHYSSSCPTAGSRSSQYVPCVGVDFWEKNRAICDTCKCMACQVWKTSKL